MTQRLDPASEAALNAMLSGGDAKQASAETSARLGVLSSSGNGDIPLDPAGSVEADQHVLDAEEARREQEASEPQMDEDVEESQEDAEQPEEDAESSDEEESSEIEEVFVKGPNGRRQKLTIDYSNREKIKKAYLQAAGMRKAFQERDAALNQLKQYTEGEYAEKVQGFDVLEKAYESEGIKGLINVLEDDPNAFERFIEQEIQRREELSLMTPEERRAYELEQEKARKDAEVERLRQEMEEFKRSVMSQKEQAELTQLETVISSAFEQYSFDGALGDPEKETLLNEMLWARGREALAQYPDDVPLTSALAKKEFRKIAKVLQDMVKIEGRKQAARAINKKKKEAAKTVQKKVTKARSNPQASGTPEDIIRQRGITGLFQAWASGQKRK